MTPPWGLHLTVHTDLPCPVGRVNRIVPPVNCAIHALFAVPLTPLSLCAADSTVQIGDEPDACAGGASARRSQLLQRLRADPGYIALLGGTDLELLGQLTPDQAAGYDAQFVADIQEASCRYLDGRRDVEEALSFLKHCKKNGN